MPRTKPFDEYPQEYDAWFDNHPKIYEAEIKTIQKLLLPFDKGIEIGIGSGRFAIPFGIKTGIEPSKKIAKIVRSRGLEVIDGIAEKLPLESETYDCVLMVTTICFVDDALQSLKEIYRILRPGGFVIIGFVERNSAIGKFYEKHRMKSRFYNEATFYTGKEVIGLLEKAGFHDIQSYQTLFGETLEDAQTHIKRGFEEGAFVAIRGVKQP